MPDGRITTEDPDDREFVSLNTYTDFLLAKFSANCLNIYQTTELPFYVANVQYTLQMIYTKNSEKLFCIYIFLVRPKIT